MTGIMLATIRGRLQSALDTSNLLADAYSTGTATAEVTFHPSGVIVPGSMTSTSPSTPYWWQGGTPPAVWISYTSTGGGTITGGMAAGTRYQLNTGRTLGISRQIIGGVDRVFTLSFHDAASGGNLLGTKTYTAHAERI